MSDFTKKYKQRLIQEIEDPNNQFKKIEDKIVKIR